ncbi:MAG: anti-sigma factor [Ktedonobacterales bacterium]|nr:anti-sigma factor [Ktedonobacterales bacterium]
MQERHVDDLLDAYALGTLEPDEVDAIERHLEGCAHCRTRAEAARSIATQMLHAAPLVAPPPALRARVLDRIRAEIAAGGQRASSQNTATSDHQTSDHQMPAPSNPVARLLRSVLGGAPAGEPEVDHLLHELLADPECGIWPIAGTEHAPGAGGRLVGVPRRREAVLLTHGLHAAPRGQEYQVWFLRGGSPQPNALFQVGQGGRATRVVHIADPLSTFEVVAVTPEPKGGSPGPTGPIVLAGTLEPASAPGA